MFESFLYGNENANHILIQPVDESELLLIPKQATLIQEMSGMDDFALLAIKVTSWNDDLSPWKAPAVYGVDDFKGCADALLKYIKKLIKSQYEGKNIILGGYSLAGLFALWAATRTDAFSGIAAASPSVWYPDFVEYIKKNTPKTGNIYLSLGNSEAKTRNQIMSTVEDCINTVFDTLQEQKITCRFELNDGNHFCEPDVRTSKAFAWVLKKLTRRIME